MKQKFTTHVYNNCYELRSRAINQSYEKSHKKVHRTIIIAIFHLTAIKNLKYNWANKHESVKDEGVKIKTNPENVPGKILGTQIPAHRFVR